MMRIYTYLFVATFIISSVNLSAQPNGPWVKTINTPEKTFAEYQQEFYEYWEGKDPESGQGYKQFKRWEYFWESRLLEDGKFPKISDYLVGVKSAKLHSMNSQVNESLWEPLGPYKENSNSEKSYGIGRVNTIAVDPFEPSIIYVGTPSGGIWKSIDGGENWLPLTDFVGAIGVSDIAIDPGNPETIYIATGDNDGGASYSSGLMKSTDGGMNWMSTGLNFNVSETETMYFVKIDPQNTQVLYVGTSDGLYKSVNAGETFEQISVLNFRDFKFKPGNSSVIYAYNRGTLVIVPNDAFYFKDDFYKSENAGESFELISSGIPASGIRRMIIAVTPQDPELVYLLVADSTNNYQGVYRSTNSGNDFTLINNDQSNISFGGQSWYDLVFGVDPLNNNTIYIGAIKLFKSTNGGEIFSEVNPNAADDINKYIHVDFHYIGFYNDNLYLGTDGGIYKSNNGANTFDDLSDGLQISQYYKINGTEQNENAIIGGLQDNGGFYTATGLNGWKYYHGGDGMECAIDPTNQNVIYGLSQFGHVFKSIDGGNNVEALGRPESGIWITPFQLDPNNNNRFLAGYTQLYEYDDIGGWNQLTDYDYDYGGFFYVGLRNIEVFSGNSDIIYIGAYSNLYKTIDGGESVVELATATDLNVQVTGISVHETNPDILWVTIAGYNDGQKVFKSIDGGLSWTNISGSLPNLPVNCIVHAVGSNGGVYIGSDFGVYYYDDNLGDWISYNNDLPNTVINDLYINYMEGHITAGTYGRGVWRSPLYSLTVDINEEVSLRDEIRIYPNPVKDELIIEFQSDVRDVFIEIITEKGKVVLAKNVLNQKLIKLDVTNIISGTYIVRFLIDGQIKSKKIIVLE